MWDSPSSGFSAKWPLWIMIKNMFTKTGVTWTNLLLDGGCSLPHTRPRWRQSSAAMQMTPSYTLITPQTPTVSQDHHLQVHLAKSQLLVFLAWHCVCCSCQGCSWSHEWWPTDLFWSFGHTSWSPQPTQAGLRHPLLMLWRPWTSESACSNRTYLSPPLSPVYVHLSSLSLALHWELPCFSHLSHFGKRNLFL